MEQDGRVSDRDTCSLWASNPKGVEGDCGLPDQETGPVGDVAGVTRHVIDSLMAFCRVLGNKHPQFRAGDVCSLAEERDRRQGERAPFAAYPEGPAERMCVPVRRQPPTPFRRVFTCLYREGRRGIVREPEGIETSPPGISSESTWSKHREPDIRVRHECRRR